MALRLTRSVDSILYGGYYLDPKNLEGSYEHRIWVRRVRDHRKYQDALVNVKSRLGVTEHLISVGGDGINLGSGININIVGIQKFELDGTPYCEHCNRGDGLHDRVVPQARLAIYAPIKYEIVRHDARKKT